MTTLARLLAQKQKLIERLQENPELPERDEIERQLQKDRHSGRPVGRGAARLQRGMRSTTQSLLAPRSRTGGARADRLGGKAVQPVEHRDNREIAEFSDAGLTTLLKERITMAHLRRKDGAAGFWFILTVMAFTVLLGLAWLELDRRTNINIKHRSDVMRQRSAAAPRPPEGHTSPDGPVAQVPSIAPERILTSSVTTPDLMEICPKEESRPFQCTGYIFGVFDQMSASRLICPPETPGMGAQAVAVALKFLNDHRESWGRSPAFLIGQSFKSAFPCDKGQ